MGLRPSSHTCLAALKSWKEHPSHPDPSSGFPKPPQQLSSLKLLWHQRRSVIAQRHPGSHTHSLPHFLQPRPQSSPLYCQCLPETQPWQHCRPGSQVRLLPSSEPHSLSLQCPHHTWTKDGARTPSLESWLHPQLAMWPRLSHLIPLRLSCFICKMDTVTSALPISKGVRKIQWDNVCKNIL